MSVYKALGDVAVALDAAVAQEGPPAPHLLTALQGDRGGATASRGIHLARATALDCCHRPAGQPGAHSVAA